MEFTDSVFLDGAPRITADGFLVANAKVARTGIQLYRGSEMGRPQMDTVRVYRPEAEVFSDKSLATYPYRPMTNDHPSNMVDAKNWKGLSIGFLGDTVARDGEFIRVPLTMMDGAAVAAYRDGKRELSVGYTAQIDWSSGTTESGEAYDAVQRDIRVNHVALVDRARAGPQARIGDSWTTPATTEDTSMADTPLLRTVTVDGLSIQTTDQGAQMVEKLQRLIADANTTHTTAIAAHDAMVAGLRATHTAAIEAKDGEIAGLKSAHKTALDAKDGEIAGLTATHTAALEAKDGEIAGLKAQIPSGAALDALIVARGKMLDGARKVLGDSFDATGKTDADIRRAAVTKRLGDAAVEGKSDDYIAAAFDTLTAVAADAVVDPVRDALRAGAGRQTTDAAAKPFAKHLDYLQNAWKAPQAVEA